MIGAILLYLFYLIIHDDGKLWRKNPLYKSKLDSPRHQEKYVHVATFLPEKRLSGIVKKYLYCVFTFSSVNELISGTLEMLNNLYTRFSD